MIDAQSINHFPWLLSALPGALMTAYVVLGKHIGVLGAWNRLRVSRREWLMAALKAGRWTSMSAIELELGFASTFRFGLRADVIRYVFSRQNAVEHISYLKRCRLMVRLQEDGKGLERTKGAVSNFRRSAILSIAAAIVLLASVILGLALADPSQKEIVSVVVVFAYVIFLFFGWLFLGFEAAHSVTALGAELFPLDGPPSPSMSLPQRAAVLAGVELSGASSGQRSVNNATEAAPARANPMPSAKKRRARSSGTKNP